MSDPYASPRRRYRCGWCRKTHHVGGIDCSGVPVGYIEDRDGPGYVDRTERDATVVGSRWADAFDAWNRTGGALGQPPDLNMLMREHGALPGSRDTIVEAICDHITFLAITSCLTLADMERLRRAYLPDDPRPIAHPDLN